MKSLAPDQFHLASSRRSAASQAARSIFVVERLNRFYVGVDAAVVIADYARLAVIGVYFAARQD